MVKCKVVFEDGFADLINAVDNCGIDSAEVASLAQAQAAVAAWAVEDDCDIVSDVMGDMIRYGRACGWADLPVAKKKAKSGRGDADAVDQFAFNKAISDNLSPDGCAMIAVALDGFLASQPKRVGEAGQAQAQVKWLADALVNLIGEDEYDEVIGAFGL